MKCMIVIIKLYGSGNIEHNMSSFDCDVKHELVHGVTC